MLPLGTMVLQQSQRAWEGMAVSFLREEIRQPTHWRIHDTTHSVVVHLGGTMSRLETELDGRGSSYGPALPGEVWTAPAGRQYTGHACGEEIYYAVLRFAPSVLAHPEGSGDIRHLDLKSVAGVRDEVLHHAVLALSELAQAPDASELEMQVLLGRIIRHTASMYGVTAPESGLKEASPVLRPETARMIREYVYHHLDHPITLEQLATLARMTVHHLLVAFRKAFLTTPAQYVIQQRLRRAQLALTTSRKDITTIALECGFSSHSHLTSLFTRELGMPPSRFRKEGAGLLGPPA